MSKQGYDHKNWIMNERKLKIVSYYYFLILNTNIYTFKYSWYNNELHLIKK